MMRALWSCVLVWSAALSAASPSAYMGEESRDVKSLAPQEISDYLSGKGMGFAKAAELNGYPGPAHVLEMSAELNLSSEQKVQTEQLFTRMHLRAIAIGQEIVSEERALDRLFASHAITPESLGERLERIGRLQGEVRQVHLAAHIEQTTLLTPAQIEQYRRLRGYDAAGEHGMHHQ
jgi:hypothetical protein